MENIFSNVSFVCSQFNRRFTFCDSFGISHESLSFWCPISCHLTLSFKYHKNIFSFWCNLFIHLYTSRLTIMRFEFLLIAILLSFLQDKHNNILFRMNFTKNSVYLQQVFYIRSHKEPFNTCFTCKHRCNIFIILLS